MKTNLIRVQVKQKFHSPLAHIANAEILRKARWYNRPTFLLFYVDIREQTLNVQRLFVPVVPRNKRKVPADEFCKASVEARRAEGSTLDPDVEFILLIVT